MRAAIWSSRSQPGIAAIPQAQARSFQPRRNSGATPTPKFSAAFPIPTEANVVDVPNLTRFDVQTASLIEDHANTFGRCTHLLTNPRVMQFGLRYAF